MGARVREGYGAGSLLAACQGEGSLTGWKGVWLSQALTPFSSPGLLPCLESTKAARPKKEPEDG